MQNPAPEQSPVEQIDQTLENSQPPFYSLFYVIAITLFFIDRVTKYWALKALSDHGYHLFPGFSLELAFNTGVSFSFFASSTGQSYWGLTALIAVIVATLMVVWRYFSPHTKVSDIGYACIMGGAVSNFYDRLYFGGVIDFIDVYYGHCHFPTFNIADTAIVIGFLFVVWETYRAAD